MHANLYAKQKVFTVCVLLALWKMRKSWQAHHPCMLIKVCVYYIVFHTAELGEACDSFAEELFDSEFVI